MASNGLSEAARLTGKPRSTIHRAMRDGRLSYAVGPDGARLIELSELERIYPVKAGGNTATDAPGVSRHRTQHLDLVADLAEGAAAAAVPTILQLHDKAVWIAEIDLRSALLGTPLLRASHTHSDLHGTATQSPAASVGPSDTVRGQHGQNAVHGEFVDSDAEVADTWRI